MPMGKGVVPDTNERCVSSARTFALQQSDVILLLGARLNWMLHFGKPPRFQADVKVIQVLQFYSYEIISYEKKLDARPLGRLMSRRTAQFCFFCSCNSI